MPANVSLIGDDALTVDMLHQYAYCPRRFHLMYVQGRWADNAYTVEGRAVHRRVDRIDSVLPDPAAPDGNAAADTGDGDEPPEVSRSVSLASDTLGLTAKLDLVATADDQALPVETKRGRVPNNAERSWEPERVQLMAQGLLLREHGYQCDHGVLYFAASRTRVDIPFTDDLAQRTRYLIDCARQACLSDQLPSPLEDSPKCNGCSLAGICLPDETLLLRRQREATAEPIEPPEDLRQLYPARDQALPVYVQEQGAVVGKRGETLVISKGGTKLATARVADVAHVALCGNVSITAQAVHMLCEKQIPIVHLSMGHWFYGVTMGMGIRNAFLRSEQFRTAADPARTLAVARQIVMAKGTNQRLMLRRNANAQIDNALRDMTDLIARVPDAASPQTLLGLEGNLAAIYFANLTHMFKPRSIDIDWDFNNRNRRPPRDPINAMLSFGYAMLAKECTLALMTEGLDPWWGLYHKPRHGRPALALDLMEEFRPLVVDSAVITAINTGMVTNRDFRRSKANCIMTPTGRKAFIRAYEARLEQLVTHPVFGYRCSWRAVVRLQARLLAKWISGDIPEYLAMTTR